MTNGRPCRCIFCRGKAMRKGRRKTTRGLRQIWMCKSCGRRFTPKNQRPLRQ